MIFISDMYLTINDIEKYILLGFKLDTVIQHKFFPNNSVGYFFRLDALKIATFIEILNIKFMILFHLDISDINIPI